MIIILFVVFFNITITIDIYDTYDSCGVCSLRFTHRNLTKSDIFAHLHTSIKAKSENRSVFRYLEVVNSKIEWFLEAIVSVVCCKICFVLFF